MTPWTLAIEQMRRPDAPPPMAREDRNALIYGAARRLIANSAGARCRMNAIVVESGIPLHYVRCAIQNNDEFRVDTQPGERALWVSLATRRKARA
jgi:hypothetical protein